MRILLFFEQVLRGLRISRASKVERHELMAIPGERVDIVLDLHVSKDLGEAQFLSPSNNGIAEGFEEDGEEGAAGACLTVDYIANVDAACVVAAAG